MSDNAADDGAKPPSASSSSPAAASGLPPTPSKAEGAGAGPIICPGHSRPVPDISFTGVTPDGYFLISACLDNKAMLRDGASGDWLGTFIGHKGAVWCARLNREATRALTGAADFSAKLWDALTGDELHNFPHRHIVKAVGFSHDGQFALTGGQEKKLRVFDLNAPDAALHTLEGHTATITACIGMQQDGNLCVTAAQEKDVRLWDLRTGETVRRIETGDAVVKGAQLSIDGSILTVTLSNRQLLFVDAASPHFTVSRQLSLPSTADCASFAPSTGLIATGCEAELWARLWRVEGGDEVGVFKGHHGPVRTVCFSPDGTAFASGSEDGTIRIWQLQQQLTGR